MLKKLAILFITLGVLADLLFLAQLLFPLYTQVSPEVYPYLILICFCFHIIANVFISTYLAIKKLWIPFVLGITVFLCGSLYYLLTVLFSFNIFFELPSFIMNYHSHFNNVMILLFATSFFLPKYKISIWIKVYAFGFIIVGLSTYFSILFPNGFTKGFIYYLIMNALGMLTPLCLAVDIYLEMKLQKSTNSELLDN